MVKLHFWLYWIFFISSNGWGYFPSQRICSSNSMPCWLLTKLWEERRQRRQIWESCGSGATASRLKAKDFRKWRLFFGCPQAALVVKNSHTNDGDAGSIPGWEDSLEKDVATHSSVLAWRIPWAEDPGSLQSTGWQRVGHNWATEHSTAQQICPNLLKS